jgi:hypothetical protein
MNLQSERTIAIHLPIYLERDGPEREKISVLSFIQNNNSCFHERFLHQIWPNYCRRLACILLQ